MTTLPLIQIRPRFYEVPATCVVVVVGTEEPFGAVLVSTDEETQKPCAIIERMGTVILDATDLDTAAAEAAELFEEPIESVMHLPLK